MLIGVLSDTHSTLHPRVVPLFREAGVGMILHAGDVGDSKVLGQLEGVAPVVAVRGNIDKSGSVAELPEEQRLEVDGVSIFMTHVGGKPGEWFSWLPEPLPDVAICGHSHISLLERLGGVLFLNPGAAGTRPRFGRPLTAALLRVEGGRVSAEVVCL